MGNRYLVKGLESDPTTDPGMWYQRSSGVWAPVGGSFADDSAPTGTTVPDVQWQASGGGGGGGGGGGALRFLGEYSVSAAASLSAASRNAAGTSGNLFQTDADQYIAEVVYLYPATNGISVRFRFITGGSPDSGANYGEVNARWVSGGVAPGGANSGLTSIRIEGGAGSDFLGNGVAMAMNATYKISNPLSTTFYKRVRGGTGQESSLGNEEGSSVRGIWRSLSQASGFEISASSGNITALVRVYGLYNAGAVGTGAADFFGATGPRSLPPTTGWSWYNQRGSTVAISGRDGSHHLNVPLGNAGASTVETARMRAAPATPYTIIANLEGPILAVNYVAYGLAFGNGGAEITMLYYGYVDGRIDLYIAPTSGGAAGSARFGPLSLRSKLTFLAIRDDGTNKKYYYATEEENMQEFFSEARTTQFTPTEVGFFAGPRQNSYPQRVTLWSWKQQSAAPA